MTNDRPDAPTVPPTDGGDRAAACAVCGTVLPADAVFCLSCGTRVSAEVTVAMTPAPPPPPEPAVPRHSAWMPGWLWTLVGVVVVAAAGVGGYVGYGMVDDGQATTAPSATIGYLGEAPIPPGSTGEPSSPSTTTLPEGMAVVPDLGWMTFDEAEAAARSAGFTLREGAGYPVATGDPRIGLVARSVPSGGAPAATAEVLWAEPAIDGGAEVRVHPGDLGVVPACTATGGSLPDGVALGIGGDRLACAGRVEVAAGSPFFIRAWWVQPGWPDPDLDHVTFAVDGETQPVECTGSWSAGSVAGSCVMTHQGIPAGPHEIVAVYVIGGEIMLTSTVTVVAAG